MCGAGRCRDLTRLQIGIDRMVGKRMYAAAFPLHDSPTEPVQGVIEGKRTSLRMHWARFGAWYKFQPLDLIRDYFGERIGRLPAIAMPLVMCMQDCTSPGSVSTRPGWCLRR